MWKKTYVDCEVTYDIDLDIVNKRSDCKYLTSWSLILAKGNNIEIWNWIIHLQVCITHIKIECEFTGNENRGSKMNRNGMSFQCFHIVKIWYSEIENFESKTCMESYHLDLS